MAARNKATKKGTGNGSDIDKLLALEKKVDAFIAGLKGKGEQILAETKEITDGLHNINPLQIGHRLIVIRGLFGVKKLDKKSANVKMFESYKKTKVYKLGFAKATINRYMGAWENATKAYPEPFVIEMASRMFGERVTPEKPFGKFTGWIAQTTKKASIKEDMASGAKSIKLVDSLLFTYKPPTGEKPKRDYILTAYDSVMANLKGYLKQTGEVEPLDSLDAKDVFVTRLAPYLLAGFGLSPEIVEQVEVASKLPPGYEPFSEAEIKEATSPMGEAARPKHHEEKHPDKPAEEMSPFAAG